MILLVLQIGAALLITSIAVTGFVLYRHTQLINFLTNEKPHNILPFATTSLTAGQIAVIFINFFLKPVLQLFGGRPSIASILKSKDGAPVKKSDSIGPQLPRLSLQMPFIISRNDLSKYQQAVSDGTQSLNSANRSNALRKMFIGSEAASVSGSCHMSLLLSALSEPAMLLLLAKQNCPIQPLGAVNVRNRFVLRRPDLVKSILSTVLESSGTATKGRPKALWQSWFAIAKCMPQARIVKRGYECDFEVKIYCLDDGEEVTVFRQVFTMLQFARHNQPVADGDTSPQVDDTAKDAANTATAPIKFRVSGSATALWASLCKDFNPIHTSRAAALLFGFSSRIAHGNLVAAQALNALSAKTLDSSLTKQNEGADAESEPIQAKVWVEVQFRRPVPISSKLEVRSASGAASSANFAVYNKDKACVTFQIGYL